MYHLNPVSLKMELWKGMKVSIVRHPFPTVLVIRSD